MNPDAPQRIPMRPTAPRPPPRTCPIAYLRSVPFTVGADEAGRLFDSLDADGSGAIDYSELKQALRTRARGRARRHVRPAGDAQIVGRAGRTGAPRTKLKSLVYSQSSPSMLPGGSHSGGGTSTRPAGHVPDFSKPFFPSGLVRRAPTEAELAEEADFARRYTAYQQAQRERLERRAVVKPPLSRGTVGSHPLACPHGGRWRTGEGRPSPYYSRLARHTQLDVSPGASAPAAADGAVAAADGAGEDCMPGGQAGGEAARAGGEAAQAGGKAARAVQTECMGLDQIARDALSEAEGRHQSYLARLEALHAVRTPTPATTLARVHSEGMALAQQHLSLAAMDALATAPHLQRLCLQRALAAVPPPPLGSTLLAEVYYALGCFHLRGHGSESGIERGSERGGGRGGGRGSGRGSGRGNSIASESGAPPESHASRATLGASRAALGASRAALGASRAALKCLRRAIDAAAAATGDRAAEVGVLARLNLCVAYQRLAQPDECTRTAQEALDLLHTPAGGRQQVPGGGGAIEAAERATLMGIARYNLMCCFEATRDHGKALACAQAARRALAASSLSSDDGLRTKLSAAAQAYRETYRMALTHRVHDTLHAASTQSLLASSKAATDARLRREGGQHPLTFPDRPTGVTAKRAAAGGTTMAADALPPSGGTLPTVPSALPKPASSPNLRANTSAKDAACGGASPSAGKAYGTGRPHCTPRTTSSKCHRSRTRTCTGQMSPPRTQPAVGPTPLSETRRLSTPTTLANAAPAPAARHTPASSSSKRRGMATGGGSLQELNLDRSEAAVGLLVSSRGPSRGPSRGRVVAEEG